MNDRTADILNLLSRSDACVSSATICRTLDVSRTAVWKHVGQLRDLGYVIESSPHRGYRLRQRPDLPHPLEVTPLLRTRVFGHRLVYLAETDSTNRVAAELARDAAAEGTVVVAESQTAGRGRMGRSWFSPPGTNLYLSVILRPGVPPARASQVSILAAIAATRAMRRYAAEAAIQIKWPNDVLANGRKVAGILCDLSAEMDRIHYLIVGIGVNVNLDPAALPPDLAATATSLRAVAGVPLSRPALLADLLLELENACAVWTRDGLAPFIAEWTAESALHRRQVVVDTPAGRMAGTVAGLTVDGALQLVLADGSRHDVVTADVHLAPPCPRQKRG
jgi:BirA family biotin operon repressor/biotin-[acetyl-CoA-carboxylase] ligase